jgi:SAM-dependent methyltransferase
MTPSEKIRSRLPSLPPLRPGVQPTSNGLKLVEKTPYRELLLGCGSNKAKQIYQEPEGPKWKNLTTLDMDPEVKPDVLHDLNDLMYPFVDSTFDEVHAYNVLEHQGSLGGFKFFFNQWNEIGRILKPGGRFFGIVPSLSSVWLFGDPGHCRVITAQMLQFLDRDFYHCGKTQSDGYAELLHASFKVIFLENGSEFLAFILKKDLLAAIDPIEQLR